MCVEAPWCRHAGLPLPPIVSLGGFTKVHLNTTTTTTKNSFVVDIARKLMPTCLLWGLAAAKRSWLAGEWCQAGHSWARWEAPMWTGSYWTEIMIRPETTMISHWWDSAARSQWEVRVQCDSHKDKNRQKNSGPPWLVCFVLACCLKWPCRDCRWSVNLNSPNKGKKLPVIH